MKNTVLKIVVPLILLVRPRAIKKANTLIKMTVTIVKTHENNNACKNVGSVKALA